METQDFTTTFKSHHETYGAKPEEHEDVSRYDVTVVWNARVITNHDGLEIMPFHMKKIEVKVVYEDAISMDEVRVETITFEMGEKSWQYDYERLPYDDEFFLLRNIDIDLEKSVVHATFG